MRSIELLLTCIVLKTLLGIDLNAEQSNVIFWAGMWSFILDAISGGF